MEQVEMVQRGWVRVVAGGLAAVVLAGLLAVAAPVAPAGATVLEDLDEAVADAKPILRWDLDDAAGTDTAVDTVGDVDGTTLSSAITKRVQGPVAGSFGYSFDHSCGGIRSESSIFRRSDFSVEFWLKTTEADTIVFASGYHGYSLRVVNGKLLAQAYRAAAWDESVQGISTIADGEWHHVVVSRSSLPKVQGTNLDARPFDPWRLRLRVDGRGEGLMTVSHPDKVWNYSPGVFFTSSAETKFGGGIPGSGCSTSNFTGSLSRIAFYDQALEDSQVRRTYCAAERPVLGGFELPDLFPVAGSVCDDVTSAIGRAGTRAEAADPVDVATGAFLMDATDLAAPSGAEPATVERRHHSALRRSGVFGPRWGTPFDTGVTELSSGDVELVEGDGQVFSLASDGSGGWVSPSDLRAVLTRDAGSGVWTLKRSDGSVDTFAASGRLVSRRPFGGEPTTFTWAPSAGVIATVAGPGGYGLTLSDSNADGLVDRVTGSDGRTVTYGYHDDGGTPVLGSVSAPHRLDAEPVGGAAAPYRVERYVTEGQLITEIWESTDGGGEHRTLLNTFDDRGRVESQVTGDGDPVTFHYSRKPGSGYLGGLVADDRFTTVDYGASGDRNVYRFDTSGQLLSLTDALGAPVERTWADAQPDTSESRSDVVTDVSYDAAGRPTSVTETSPAGTKTVQAHTYVVAASATGAAQDRRLATTTDAAGVTTEYGYASSGDELPSEIRVPCDAASSAVACPSGGKAVTSIVYDATFTDLVFRQTDPDGVKTEYAYWPDRSVKTVKTFPDGTTPSTTSYTYAYPSQSYPSGLGWSEPDTRVVKVVTVTPPGRPASSTRYDAEGRVIEERDGLYDGTTHKATRYTYTSGGDLKTVTDPADRTTTHATVHVGEPGFPAGLPAEVTRVETVTDPDGISERTLFDKSGDAVQEWRGKLANPATIAKTISTFGELARLETTVDPMGVKTTYTYDAEGRVLTTTVGPNASDPAHRTTSAYDGWGNQSSETGPADTDPSSVAVQSKTTYTYDGAGRVRTKIEGALAGAAEKLMTSYVYDAAGRLFRTIEHRNGDIDTSHWATIANGDKVTETRYTLAGRTKKTVEPGADNPAFDWSSADSAKRITTVGYDAAGRQTTVTDPRGKTTTTTYTPAGEVDTVTSPAGRVTDYDYDALGRRVAVTTPSGLPAGQPATVAKKTSYWPGGEVKTETDPHIPVTGVTDPSTRTFHYTPGGRLDDVTDALGRHVTYTFDDRGNRATRTSADDAGSARVESWSWDLNDNLKTHTVPPPRAGAAAMTTSYVYDYDGGPSSDDYGRLVSVTDPTGRTETRSYYGSGAVKSRTWTKTGATTKSSTVWLDSRGRTTKMRDTTGSTNRDTSYVFDRVGQTTKITTPVGSTDYSWDLAGSLRDLTQADGTKFRYAHLATGQISEYQGWSTGSGAYLLIASYNYDDDGLQIGEWIYSAAGSTRANTLNAAGRTSTFTEVMRRPDNSPMWETYTAQLTYRADQRLGSEQVNGATTATMTYDSAGQLTAQTGTNPVAYSYGTRGNRLTQTAGGNTTSYTTNPNGSIATATTGTTVVTYDYDDAGRRTAVTTKVKRPRSDAALIRVAALG